MKRHDLKRSATPSSALPYARETQRKFATHHGWRRARDEACGILGWPRQRIVIPGRQPRHIDVFGDVERARRIATREDDLYALVQSIGRLVA